MAEEIKQTVGQDVGKLEDSMVARYRVWEGWSRFAYKHAKGDRIARIIGESGGVVPRVLEVGVGPGGVAAAVCRHGMSVVGIDVTPAALVTAQKHCRGLSVFLARASGFSLPFRDGSFEVAYCSQVMHLFEGESRERLMAELARVVRPGGRFVFDMKNIASHPIQYLLASARKRRTAYPSDPDLKALAANAGFELVGVWPGLLPRLSSTTVPNIAVFRHLAHTRFYVVRRRA